MKMMMIIKIKEKEKMENVQIVTDKILIINYVILLNKNILFFFYYFKNYIKFHQNSHIIHIYGLAQNPITKEYIFVMDYMDGGNLHYYLTNKFKNLKWKDKIGILYHVIS